MKRLTVAAVLFALCNAVGAQGPRSAPTPAQKAQLFERNYTLVEKLVDSGLKLTKQTDPLSRTESFRNMLVELEQQIKAATADGEKARVAELNEHLKSLMDKAVLPNLGAARVRISQGHIDEKRLFDMRDQAERMGVDLRKAIDNSGIADSPEAKQLRKTLDETKIDLDKKLQMPEVK